VGVVAQEIAMVDLGFLKSLFSKSKKTPESLFAGAHLDAISDETYASDVRKMILEEEPGGRTMTVIAYETLKVIYAYSMKLKSEGKYPEFSLESLIASTIEQGKKAKSQNDEINWRRFTWFATAASVMRLDWAVIKRHPELAQVGAEIWLAGKLWRSHRSSVLFGLTRKSFGILFCPMRAMALLMF
jgi:hypothetical protein